MTQGSWLLMEIEGREVVRERLAEAEHERLIQQAEVHPRRRRSLVADALRGVARRLDGDVGPSGERRLAPAR
jgi:hypothetical protein